MILDNSQIWEKYNALNTEKEKQHFLKTYLLGLKPQDLYDFLLTDIDNLGVELIDLVSKRNLNKNDSNDLTRQLDLIIENLEKTRQIRKAA
jgi:hypothetical protein